MLKKTHVMTQNFTKDKSENQEGGEKVIWRIPIEAPKSRKNMEAYLIILQIIQGIAVMILALSVIMR